MKLLFATSCLLTAFAFSGCQTAPNQTAKTSGPESIVATAMLSPASGSEVRGMVTFIRVSEGIRVVARLSGLTPGKHGFHIHEKGDCSAPDASSAGGHFNPTGHPHGGPSGDQRHVGDFGNLEADSSGHAVYSRVFPDLTMEGEASILGRGLIVHAKADDLKTQPTGDAGGRVACGVIEGR